MPSKDMFKDALKRFDSNISSRGLLLFNEGKIKVTRFNEISAEIEASGSKSDIYHVHIEFDSKEKRILKMNCDCAYGRSKGNCKHLAGALYALEKISDKETGTINAQESYSALQKKIVFLSNSTPEEEVFRLGSEILLLRNIGKKEGSILSSSFVRKILLNNPSFLSNKKLNICYQLLLKTYEDEKERSSFVFDIFKEILSKEPQFLSPLFLALYRYKETRKMAIKAFLKAKQKGIESDYFLKAASPYNESISEDPEFMKEVLAYKTPLFPLFLIGKKTLLMAINNKDEELVFNAIHYLLIHHGSFTLPSYIFGNLKEETLLKVLNDLMDKQRFDFVTFL